MELPSLTLKSKKDQPVRRFHPWIFSNAIKSTEGELEEGCIVEVLSNKGKRLGYGHYQQQGSISVRMLSFGPDEFSYDIIAQRVKDAWRTRINMGMISNETKLFSFDFCGR